MINFAIPIAKPVPTFFSLTTTLFYYNFVKLKTHMLQLCKITAILSSILSLSPLGMELARCHDDVFLGFKFY